MLESSRSSQQTTAPLKSPTDARSVHFPLIDLSSDSTGANANNTTITSYDQPTALTSAQNAASPGSLAANPIVKSVRR